MRTLLRLLLVVSAVSAHPVLAQGSWDCQTIPILGEFKEGDSHEGVTIAVQQFPASGESRTAWKVAWSAGEENLFQIVGAWFRRAPDAAWTQVLCDAYVQEVFVPYHSGMRIYDLHASGASADLVPATAADAGCCGTLLGEPPVVIREIRDRGPLWKNDQQVHRGQELVLWATIDVGNYNYIVEYGFRDDGTVGFRFGATGSNLPGREQEAHIHNALWRVDVDVTEPAHNNAMWARHVEPASAPTQAVDIVLPFNCSIEGVPLHQCGTEGGANWHESEFSELIIEHASAMNSRGHRIGYVVMPMIHGHARHEEPFTQNTVWVTREGYEYAELPAYVKDRQPVTDADVIVWVNTPAHHRPRDEDGKPGAQAFAWHGVAITMWTGFELKPRNLFSETPFYP